MFRLEWAGQPSRPRNAMPGFSMGRRPQDRCLPGWRAAGGDSGSPGTPLLHCGEPVGGLWGWVRVQLGHAGLNPAGFAFSHCQGFGLCSVTTATWCNPQGRSRSSRATAWPPHPRSTSITSAVPLLLTSSGCQYMLWGSRMQFAANNLCVKPRFGSAFVEEEKAVPK